MAFAGNKVRERRMKLSRTQQNLAKEVNVSTEFISLIENGHSNPSVEVLESIARALRCKVDYFFADNVSEGNREYVKND